VKRGLGLGGAITFAVVCGHLVSAASNDYVWNLPAWVPRPVVPADNPMRPAKVELGRYLFYEKQLSVTGKMSCASCHEQARAFSDGQTVAVGATGEKHPRNAMSLTNMAYASYYTWNNPLQRKLETQLLTPLFGEHPVEMGMVGREAQLLTFLKQDPAYAQRFQQAFPEDPQPVSIANLAKAIASFERTLLSFNSPYDRYRWGGEPDAISDAAKRGERLFSTERLECFHCHGGLVFSDSVIHEKLPYPEIAFHNTGLYNLNNTGAYPPQDPGVFAITQRPEHMGRFKAPTLRNIALTAPYMHDGSIATLEEVLDHYAAGGRTISQGKYAGVGSKNPFKSGFIHGFKLTPEEKQDMLAFLQSLTDESFIHNPTLSDPNQPSKEPGSPPRSSAPQSDR